MVYKITHNNKEDTRFTHFCLHQNYPEWMLVGNKQVFLMKGNAPYRHLQQYTNGVYSSNDDDCIDHE